MLCVKLCSAVFLINGALLFGKTRSWKNIYRKAAKILVLTIVWSLVGFPSWFFKTLFILYALFPLFQHLREKKIKLYYAIIIALLIFPFGYNAVILPIKLFSQNGMIYILKQAIDIEQLRVTGLFTMYSVVYFLLGPVLAKLSTRTIYGVAAIFGGMSMVVFECVSYTAMNGTMYDGVNSAFPTYGALLLSAGMFIVAKNMIKTGSKIVALIRDQILAIYLLHMAVIRVIGRVIDLPVISLPTAIIGTLLILLMCAGVGKIAGRMPVLCWFFRI